MRRVTRRVTKMLNDFKYITYVTYVTLILKNIILLYNIMRHIYIRIYVYAYR